MPFARSRGSADMLFNVCGSFLVAIVPTLLKTQIVVFSSADSGARIDHHLSCSTASTLAHSKIPPLPGLPEPPEPQAATGSLDNVAS